MAVSAHYGAFSFFLTEDDATALDETILPTAIWQGSWACDYAPFTPSGSGDGTLVLPIIGTATWSVSSPFDVAADPTFLGLTEGTVIYQAFFAKGNSGLFDIVDRTTLTSVQILNNNGGDAVRVVLTGMGGRVAEDEA